MITTLTLGLLFESVFLDKRSQDCVMRTAVFPIIVENSVLHLILVFSLTSVLPWGAIGLEVLVIAESKPTLGSSSIVIVDATMSLHSRALINTKLDIKKWL